jgi:hypothetical protein
MLDCRFQVLAAKCGFENGHVVSSHPDTNLQTTASISVLFPRTHDLTSASWPDRRDG